MKANTFPLDEKEVFPPFEMAADGPRGRRRRPKKGGPRGED